MPPDFCRCGHYCQYFVAQMVYAIHIAFLPPCLRLPILFCHSPSSPSPPCHHSSPILSCRHLQVGCRDSGATFMRHMATAFVCLQPTTPSAAFESSRLRIIIRNTRQHQVVTRKHAGIKYAIQCGICSF